MSNWMASRSLWLMRDAQRVDVTLEAIDPMSWLGGEREREIYIFPWSQVRITGPRYHLTSSLRGYRRGMTRLG